MSELERWAGRPGPAKALAAARRRLERGAVNARLPLDLTTAERHELGQLLGIDWQISGKPVTLKLFRVALVSYEMTLEGLVEAVSGPLADHRAERAQAEQTRRDEFDQARDALAQVLPEHLVDDVATACLPAREPLARAIQLASLAQHLPAQTYLPVLAAQCFEDAHALDRNRALGRSGARLAALLGGLPPLPTGFGARQWREAWATVGVSCDRVSTMVLTLNLPLTGPDPVPALTGAAGEPVWLTARLVDRAGPPDPPAEVVFVCENPSVVESAADRLGVRCRPLICTFGIPSQAALDLVRMLDEAGSRVLIRADNDRAGRRIVAALQVVAPGARPWRYDDDSPIYEEQVLEDLLADLESGPPPKQALSPR